MKKIFKNSIILLALSLAGVGAFTSCSEWTDTEGLKVNDPNLSEQNPEQYAKYMESLRTYKATDHKLMYVWFDNSRKTPTSYAHHICTVPDSVDVISMMHADSLSAWELEDMKTVRQKGTKVIFTFSYAKIEALYAESVAAERPAPAAEEGGTPAPAEDKFLAFMSQYVDYALGLVGKYNYDGVAAHYEPLSTLHMNDADKAIAVARQQLFIGKLAEWIKANPEKMFVFEGQIYNLLDKTILNSCRYIVLNTLKENNAMGLTSSVMMSLRDGVPADRFIVSVSQVSLDPMDPMTGNFIGENGELTRAITEAAYWTVTTNSAFAKIGLGVYNVQNDYYENSSLIYKYTREAIAIMNPSPKN